MQSQYNMLLDRHTEMSDDQAVNKQDALNATRSQQPPLLIPRQISNQVHWFRSSSTSSFLSSTAVNTLQGIFFSFNQIPGYTDYQTVFDEYAIIACVVRIYPAASTALSDVGKLTTCIDYDDANLISAAQIREYGTCMETKGSVGQTRVVYPRIANALYSGTFTSFGSTRSWIDIASPAVQHYGLKVAVDPTSIAIPYDTDVQYTFCCRSNR
jgi:hypothetical protein